MWQWLDQLRTRPLAYRRNVAMTGAFGITAVVAVMWVVTLPERFAAISATEPAPIEREGSLARLFSSVREQVGVVGVAVENLSTATEEAESVEDTATSSAVTETTTFGVDTLLPPTGRQILISTSSATTS